MAGLVVEPGPVAGALLAMVRDGGDDHALSEGICLAYLDGLDVDGASISLGTDGVRETLWVSDPIAELLEDLQSTLNEGVRLDAARFGSPVSVPDLRHKSATARWPLLAAAMAEQVQVRAVFALPLQWGAINLGVLGLYRVSSGELPVEQWRDALSSADIAALMLLSVWTEPGGSESGAWLDHSLGGRPEIHQATGMVLVQLGVSATDALARLRAYAFVEQRLLVDVARDVVARRLRFTQDMG